VLDHKVAPTITLPEPKDLDLEPMLAPPSHNIFVMLFEKDQVMKSYSDQTGRFPVPSSQGNHHIFVLYHQDTNTIHVVAIPNRQAASIRKAWESTHKKLTQQGHAPNLHILDNECSQELKDAFTNKVQNRFSTSASKRTSCKCCRKSHSDLQKLFYFHSLLGRLQFSNEQSGKTKIFIIEIVLHGTQ
jgi:hypothetical protein